MTAVFRSVTAAKRQVFFGFILGSGRSTKARRNLIDHGPPTIVTGPGSAEAIAGNSLGTRRSRSASRLVFKKLDDLFACDRREALEKFVNRIPGLKVIEQCLHRDSGSAKNRSSAHHIGVRADAG